MAPRVYHRNGLVRALKLLGDWLLHPVINLKVLFVDDWAKRTQVLLFMQTVDSTLRMVRGRFGLATNWTSVRRRPRSCRRRWTCRSATPHRRRQTGGHAQRNPARHSVDRAHPRRRCMGSDASEGAIDRDNRVFGYRNMLCLRRLDDFGQPRRQPFAVDHRDQRARDEQSAAARLGFHCCLPASGSNRPLSARTIPGTGDGSSFPRNACEPAASEGLAQTDIESASGTILWRTHPDAGSVPEQIRLVE